MIFSTMMIMYGLILTVIKSCLNNDFRLATFWEKFQHIVETLNVPEVFGDWDDDHDLDIAGHLKKWWKVLVEMLVMIFTQLIFNMILLVPIWVTGMKLEGNKKNSPKKQYGVIHKLHLKKRWVSSPKMSIFIK